MKSRLIRCVLVALGTSAVLCAASAESRACCLFGRSNTTYYAPAAVMPACNTCNYAPAAVVPACNTCNYAPQVSYRSVFTSVPVTTYRPITTVNPCTGCPTTVVQPITTYRMQPSLVPVTTYRPVATCCYAPSCATGACGTPACSTGACGGAVAAPIASSYYAPSYPVVQAAPGCSTCNGGASAYAPAAPQVLSAPATAVPSLPPTTPVPLPDSSSSISTPPTYRQSTAVDTQPALRAIPDNGGASGTRNSNTIVPRMTDPNDRQTARPREDRMTAKPITGNWYQPASLRVALPAEAPAEEGNWHAAGR